MRWMKKKLAWRQWGINNSFLSCPPLSSSPFFIPFDFPSSLPTKLVKDVVARASSQHAAYLSEMKQKKIMFFFFSNLCLIFRFPVRVSKIRFHSFAQKNDNP